MRLGDLLPFKFLEVDHLKVHIRNGLDWIALTEKTFFAETTDEKKSLLQLLCPESFPEQAFMQAPSEVVATYKKCEHQKRTGPPEVVEPKSLRPTLDVVLQLLISLQRLPMRIPEGEILLCVTERAMSWEDKCKEFLSRKEVQTSVDKLAETKDECDLEMSKMNQEDLENLIFDGELLEITLPDKNILWRLFNALKKTATMKKAPPPTPVVEPPATPQAPTELTTEVLGKRLRKTKNEDDEKSEPKKKTKKNFKSNNKKVEKVSSSDDEDDDEEECSAENCLNPTGREVDWVQCDGGCNKWFHMYCVGIKRNEVSADDDYNCKRCKVSPK